MIIRGNKLADLPWPERYPFDPRNQELLDWGLTSHHMGFLRAVFSFSELTEPWKREHLTRSVADGYTDLVDVVVESGESLEWLGDVLVEGAKVGQFNVVESILATGAGIIKGTRMGEALWRASESGYSMVVDRILETGIDLRSEIFLANSPLAVASARSHLKIVKRLLDAGADPEADINSTTPFLIAVSSDQVGIIAFLLRTGVDVNRKAPHGRPLFVAASLGSIGAVDLLLEVGADVNAISDFGTALMGGSKHGCLRTVEKLLQAGANVNVEVDGRTALQQALQEGHEDVVARLLRAGADPTLTAATRTASLLSEPGETGLALGPRIKHFGLTGRVRTSRIQYKPQRTS